VANRDTAPYLSAVWVMSMFTGRMSMFTGRSNESLIRIEMNRGEAAVKARIEGFQKGSLPRQEEALP